MKYSGVTETLDIQSQIKRRMKRISAINTVAETVSQSLDLSLTLNKALEVVTEVVGCEAAGITLLDKARGEFVLRAQLGWPVDMVSSNPMRIPMNEGMSGEVMRTDDAVVYNDLDGSEQYAAPQFRDKTTFRSMVLVPMHAHGEIIGILSTLSNQPHQFDEELVSMLRAVADTVGIAIENARLHEQRVESEKRLEAILRSTADGIIATDPDSCIRMMNPAAEELLELNATELIGTPLRQIPMTEHIREKLLFTLSDGGTEGETKTFQTSLNDDVQLSVLVSPVQVESQLTTQVTDGWVILLRDITHLKEAEIARAQFIQAAAHDMKNPLTVTQSAINILGNILERSEDDTVNEVMHMAYSGIERIQHLIDDLLNIEKIESGLGFHIQDVDIREFCHEIDAIFTPLMADKDRNFGTEFRKNVPSQIPADSGWLKRAITNYLENAIKYTPSGSNITFSVYAEAPYLHFEVQDNGPGISAVDQSQLFNRFFRVGDQKNVKGSGLGLAIVKSIAERHGGSVYVNSTVGEGSTFGLTIPLEGS